MLSSHHVQNIYIYIYFIFIPLHSTNFPFHELTAVIPKDYSFQKQRIILTMNMTIANAYALRNQDRGKMSWQFKGMRM